MPRRRSQAQEDAVRKAGKVSGERRRAAAKRKRDTEHREAQERCLPTIHQAELHDFTVIAVWEDSDPQYQRFAELYEAPTVQAAEAMARHEHGDGLLIAGVVYGRPAFADVSEYDQGFKAGIECVVVPVDVPTSAAWRQGYGHGACKRSTRAVDAEQAG